MTSNTPFDCVTVLGAGAWGTALANLLAINGVKTTLWAREKEVVEAITATGENTPFLPGAPLARSLAVTNDLGDAYRAGEAVLLVVPAQFNRAILTQLSGFGLEKKPVALCSKGIETSSGKLMSDVLSEMWPSAQMAVLSGPSFAIDVAKGLPTAVTLACEDDAIGARWVASLGAPHFRPYLSSDIIGAELGGAVKNVLAIAAGVVEGRGFGESARAALIARGFAEFQRLGVAMGADAQTMAGLSGLGDLILTASSTKSRNMSLGAALGRGETLEEIMASRNTVAEGVATAPAIARLVADARVDAPIINAVAALVAGENTAAELIDALLSRPFTREAG